jgi:hypothetical protein
VNDPVTQAFSTLYLLQGNGDSIAISAEGGTLYFATRIGTSAQPPPIDVTSVRTGLEAGTYGPGAPTGTAQTCYSVEISR